MGTRQQWIVAAGVFGIAAALASVAIVRGDEAVATAAARQAGKPAETATLALVKGTDSVPPATLPKPFADRPPLERWKILSAAAGQRDDHTLELIKAGLDDKVSVVQRLALLRLLPFPPKTADPLIDQYLGHAPPEGADLARAVKQEVAERQRFGFLKGASGPLEKPFPSQNGVGPMVSPDGHWVAYTQTGWGRPGGTGGMGRSNLLTIAHVVKADGTADRVVSDMSMAGWMADSKRVGTARDCFAAITGLDGTILAEFGAPLPPDQTNPRDEKWLQGDLRGQFGTSMPHRKRVDATQGAFSPDGKWFGPRSLKNACEFWGADGTTLRIPLKDKQSVGGQPAWSPDGRRVACLAGGWGMTIIDLPNKTVLPVTMRIDMPYDSAREYQDCRWNPWSPDGRRLTFISDEEVWVSAADGTGEKKITFDATRKAWPTFSRNGKLVAYFAWQDVQQESGGHVAPVNLWVVDVETMLAVRLTAAPVTDILSLDWLDDQTLIVDHVKETLDGFTASLATLSLTKPAGTK